MRLIIAGGRDFSNYKLFSKTMEDFVEFHGIPSEVVSGKCPTGADYYGERWAESKHVIIKGFPADWNKHGKAAGPIRNSQMAEHADRAVIFWDGKSRGTKSMIEEMKRLGKPYTVVHYSNPSNSTPLNSSKSSSLI